MENLKVVLLLTGTINPDGMSLTELQDIQTREAHYIESIMHWCKKPNLHVVFVENSNTNISGSISSDVDISKLEILTFNGNDYNKSLGKGYGELSCIKYAMLHSKFLNEADFIFKVTGRYIVLNYDFFFNSLLKEDKIDLLIDLKLNLTFADSRFFGFTKNFISNYLAKYESIINDSKGIFFETILCKAALNAIADGYVYRPMYTLPRIKGFSGSLGKRFNSNYLHWLRHMYKYYLKYKSIGLGHMPDF